MKSLIEHLCHYSKNDILWYTPDMHPIDVSYLFDTITLIDRNKWKGKRIALGNMPILDFVLALIFFDGLADTILLLPTEENIEVQESRLNEASIDYIFNESNLNFTSLFEPTLLNIKTAHFTNTTLNRSGNISTTWLLPTSGTTGTPKLIPHNLISLTRTMSHKHIGNKYVWGSLYNLRRFAGLQVFLQAWLAGTPLILNEQSDDITKILSQLTALNCNAISATPSMWRKLAMHPQFNKLKLKQITLGGEIADQGVLNILKYTFPSARITHIYASTEAGVGFSVRDSKSGFPITYLDNPPAGIKMQINEKSQLCFKLNKSWVDSGDVVKIEHDRVLFIGRANGSINVGGNKVMPEEVENTIKELPEISFVQVTARKNPILGNLVEASISVTTETIFDITLKKKIIKHCQNKLEAYKVPAFITVNKEIKLNSSGKILRENT